MPDLPQELTLESAKEYIEKAIREAPPLEFIQVCSAGDNLNGFDWRDYIEIRKFDESISDKEFEMFKGEMEAVLNKLSTIPEIQQCLDSNRELYSMNILGYVPFPAKITLSPTDDMDMGTRFNRDNIIYINPWQLEHIYTVDNNSKKTQISIYSVLGHEIFHAGDPQIKAANEAENYLKAIDAIYGGDDAELIVQANKSAKIVNENAAVTRLEAKISNLVGEPARTDYHDSAHLYIAPYNQDMANKLMPEVEMILSPGVASANWGCGVNAPGR